MFHAATYHKLTRIWVDVKDKASDPCFFIFHMGDRQTRCQGWKIHSREMLNFEGEDDRILMVQKSGSEPGMYAKTLLKKCKCQQIVHTWQFFVTIFGFG